MLAQKIDNHPSLLALLDVCEGESHGLGTAQSAADQHGKQRAIPLARQGGGIGRLNQSFRLAAIRPIPQAHAALAHAAHPRDARCQFLRDQSVVGCFRDKFAQGA